MPSPRSRRSRSTTRSGRACGPAEGAEPLRIPTGADVYVGVDVGWYHDSTAVVWAARVEGRIVLRAKVWTTQEEQLGQYVPGGRMRLELVEQFIERELGS